MTLITGKAVVGLIVGVIVLLVLYNVSSSFIGLLPQYSTIDKQSYNSFEYISRDIDKLSLNNPFIETYYNLKDGYLIEYLNPDSINDKIKQQSPVCTLRSCLCLCLDLSCEKFECKEVNKKFKNSGQISSGGGVLKIRYDSSGVSIDQNNNK